MFGLAAAVSLDLATRDRARSPKIRRAGCNELARGLLSGCLVCVFSIGSLPKDRAGGRDFRLDHTDRRAIRPTGD